MYHNDIITVKFGVKNHKIVLVKSLRDVSDLKNNKVIKNEKKASYILVNINNSILKKVSITYCIHVCTSTKACFFIEN